jgi:hypothetical protein
MLGQRRGAVEVDHISCRTEKGKDICTALLDAAALCATELVPVLIEFNGEDYWLDPKELVKWALSQKRDE